MTSGHDRWDPLLPPTITVPSGGTVELDVADSAGGRITRDSSVEALAALADGSLPMTGPVAVEGAEPGDLLEVELLDLQPSDFGWSAVVPALSALPGRFAPFLVRWELRDGVARSPDLPGVAIAGRPLLGVIGVAPSIENVRRYAERERRLGGRTQGPGPADAIESGLSAGPPRENGGNMDLAVLTVGSRLTLPVQVPGALLSVGDPHFRQGDGEALSSGIEMRCRVRLRLSVVKARDAAWVPALPTLTFDATGRDHGAHLATTGISVDADGESHRLDVNVAIRRALDEMVGYLTQVRGYSAEQAGIIVGVAADLRIGQIVNDPNATAMVALPLAIFD